MLIRRASIRDVYYPCTFIELVADETLCSIDLKASESLEKKSQEKNFDFNIPFPSTRMVSWEQFASLMNVDTLQYNEGAA